MSGRSQRGDPERIGRFRISGRLGSGAMGVVYAADDEVMGRRVALKVLIADLESDPETRARFYREALAAARVIHPNVITIFDAGEDGGRSFIAMQLLQGAPLAQYLTTPEAAPLERKLDLMMQVCEGLSAAHAHEVVHRDLKPSNLFVQTDGLLKILDFGVARLAGSNMTAAGTVLGTPDYMSPEQARGTQVTASSDIFSAGAVFHYMLTGTKPFKGPDLRSLLRQLATEDPEPLPSVPPELAAIVLRAMAKDPAARPGRIEDVLALLLRFRRAYLGETRRLVLSARALRTTVLDLAREVDAAAAALGDVRAAEAAQARKAIASLDASFPPLAAGESALDLPAERQVVDDVVAALKAQRDALEAVRDAKRQLATRVDAGRAALTAGDARGAMGHFEAVLAADAASPLVEELIDSARPLATAQEALERRVSSRVDAARRALAASDWSLAIRECQQALSLAPAHQDAAALLADARAGQVEGQRRSGALVAGHLDRASAAIEARTFEVAASALEAADALQPGLPETATLRRQLTEERALAEVETEVQRLVAEEIRHTRAAFRRGRADEAVQQLRAFIETEPRAEALGAELERLEQLRDVLASGAAAARRAAGEHQRRAAQLAGMGVLDDAVAAARQALAADPTDVSIAALLDQLLVNVFDARVKQEEERLALERADCARPALEAARRALAAGYIEFASRAAAAAGRVAPASTEARALADEAAAQMDGEDLEIVDLGPPPYESERADSRVSPAAPGVGGEPLRFDRAIGMLKSVFSKSAPAPPKRQGTRR